MSNVDEVIKHVLANTQTLSAPKIVALAQVVKALGGESPVMVPNEIKAETTLLDEEQPMKLSDIDNIEIEGMGKRGVKIYQ
jgi:hypothetical protein